MSNLNDTRYLENDPDKVECGPKVTVRYTNYRGETADRVISPDMIWLGYTKWHPKMGWLLRAYDWGKCEWRDFQLTDCDFVRK